MKIASCSCGNLTATVEGDPIRYSVCHCRECQKRTGSVFGAQARFPSTAVSIFGESRSWVRVADSGNKIAQHFCPTCGSIVFLYYLDKPEWTIIATGAFADPTLPAPVYSVYEATKHHWVVLPEGIEHHD